MQGGLYNSLIRALQQLGLADAFGGCRIPLLVLNVTHPIVPKEVGGFCIGKRAVLVLEEGTPEYIEKDILTALRRQDVQTQVHGKDLLSANGEYNVEVIARGLLAFCERWLPGVPPSAGPAPGSPATPGGASSSPPRWCAAAGAAAQLLRRLPGAAGVLGAETRSAERRPGCTWRPTSAAMRWPPSSRSRQGIRSSATA